MLIYFTTMEAIFEEFDCPSDVTYDVKILLPDPKRRVAPQNVIIAAKCNINAKCNKNRRKM